MALPSVALDRWSPRITSINVSLCHGAASLTEGNAFAQQHSNYKKPFRKVNGKGTSFFALFLFLRHRGHGQLVAAERGADARGGDHLVGAGHLGDVSNLRVFVVAAVVVIGDDLVGGIAQLQVGVEGRGRQRFQRL